MPGRPDPLSPYQPGSGPLHRLPATAKLAVTVALVLVVALAPRRAWGVYAVAGLVGLVGAALSGLPPRRLIARLLTVEPFAVGVALLSLLQPGGLGIFLALLAKSTLCLFGFVLLAMTTRLTDLLHALRALRMPGLIVTTLALTYRYLFLLVDEAGRMRRARSSRTCEGSRRLVWRLTATVIAQLFLRSAERAERVYAAMCARGFGRERP
ncbi:MAG TPA: cobalt ECF transporter T component CbiQ [Candidatus Eisenbacteria bacterium]|jgi:cobalt/nickel transport system permease protein